MMKKYLILISALTISFISVACSDDVKENPDNRELSSGSIESAEKAPDFSLTSTNGESIKLSDYQGKVVILDFWATWCPPCRKGIPDLVEIQNEFKDDVIVIGVSLDDDTKSEVVPFMKEYGINYPVVYGDNKVVTDFGSINAIPTSFIINKKGEIVEKHVGLVPKSTYVNRIKQILG